MNERIKKLRKALDLTQQKFADRLGMKQNTIATYEMGRANPSDQTIRCVCREFGVSEEWLRTGKGEMFAPKSEEDELKQAINTMLHGRNSNFKRRLFSVLSSLDESDWVILEKKVTELAKAIVQEETATPIVPSASPATVTGSVTDEALHAELDRQLAEEKKPTEGSSACGHEKLGSA